MAITDAVTNIPPKRMVLIVGGGLAVGLLWRYMSGRSSGPSGGTVAGDSTGLPLPTVGNLGGSETTGDRRDVWGSGITLPVSKWIIEDSEGNQYVTDGSVIDPLTPTPSGDTDPPSPTTPPPTTPTATGSTKWRYLATIIKNGSPYTQYGTWGSKQSAITQAEALEKKEVSKNAHTVVNWTLESKWFS